MTGDGPTNGAPTNGAPTNGAPTNGALAEPDLAAHADALLDANAFLTLSTVDAEGRPWATPVYFAPAPGWRFLWTSGTQARHSGNLADRPEISLVVFDSTVAPYHGRALYAVGIARELKDDQIDEALQHYPGSSRRGLAPMARDEVTGSSGYRLYEATASKVWVLCPREAGQACPIHGQARDHRARVL